jgi:hypothetical protein
LKIDHYKYEVYFSLYLSRDQKPNAIFSLKNIAWGIADFLPENKALTSDSRYQLTTEFHIKQVNPA